MNLLPDDPQPGRLLLVDGHSLIYRSFYAIPNLVTSSGFPSNAVYGFARTLLKVLRQWPSAYAALTMDAEGETIRHQQYEEYKANRPEMPEDLATQIPKIEQLTTALGIPVIKLANYEADDLIASFVQQALSRNWEVLIVSNDKDLMQLVDEDIKMIVPSNSDDEMELFDGERVEEKLGVPPEKVRDFLALQGDQSDNIPGIPQVGKVRAKKLLQQFGSLEDIFNNLDQISSDRIKENLITHEEQAWTGQQLVRLHADLEVDDTLNQSRLSQPDLEELRAIFKELEFSSLLSLLPTDSVDIDYQIIQSEEELDKLMKEIAANDTVSLDLETTNINPHQADLVGLSFSFRPTEGYYLPVDHQCPHLDRSTVLSELKEPLQNPDFKKIGQNLKYDSLVLKREGIDLQGIVFDSMLASYLLKPSKRNHNLKEIAKSYLDRNIEDYDQLEFPEDNEDFRQLDIEVAAQYAVQDAEVIWDIKQKLKPKLRDREQLKLLSRMEVPLINILRDMELNGIKLEQSKLSRAKNSLKQELDDLQQSIDDVAGEHINPNSPKQVREILFDKLDLPVIERTKTGPSTNARVLKKLSAEHPLPEQIIDYRELDKLINTYLNKLPDHINPQTGRVHTSFNQTATATGRLSSSDPNLQNIPKGSGPGQIIRTAFVAESGHRLLGADYSQIELRLLAHLSGDEELIETFNQGEDLHNKTASHIHEVGLDQVTTEMREEAKRVNYGIVYGITPYGLANDLDISKQQAQRHIDRFFDLYPQAKSFIDRLVNQAEQHKYAETFLGRRRYLPNINHNNWSKRNYARRNAINTPIQGGAADLMKLAMIEVHSAIESGKLDSDLLLQVHDELILETPQLLVESEKSLVRDLMEEVMELSVPLAVDIKSGRNWGEL